MPVGGSFPLGRISIFTVAWDPPVGPVKPLDSCAFETPNSAGERFAGRQVESLEAMETNRLWETTLAVPLSHGSVFRCTEGSHDLAIRRRGGCCYSRSRARDGTDQDA